MDIQTFTSDFRWRYGCDPLIVSAPGRVNLIGEHTDYNEGFVLPFAIDKRTYVAYAPRRGRTVSVYSRTLDKAAEFDLDQPNQERIRDWSTYIEGMAKILERRGLSIPGARMTVNSTIPFGAGLSSSAALEIAVGYALASLGNNTIDERELAFAGQEVEHEFFGVQSGIMDQFASALSLEGHVMLIDCRTFEVEHIPLQLNDLMLVVCDTGVKHDLAATAYNQRRLECQEGVALLGDRVPGINALRDVTFEDLATHSEVLPPLILKRCRHVVSENDRTLRAAAAIRSDDLAALGRLMFESHDSLRDDYEVSCIELDTLVEIALEIPGVVGARMTGGGFGGCTINLIAKASYPEFERKTRDSYASAFGRDPSIFEVKASNGAGIEEP